MKVTIEFDEELADALQTHLDGGPAVQTYIKAALKFFRDMRRAESKGSVSVGYGDKTRFSTYNTIVSPTDYLNEEANL